MSRKGRLERHEERRVPMQRAVSGERLICAVRRRHDSYLVTEYRMGEAAPLASHAVNMVMQACTCGEPYPCLHAKAVRRADQP